MLSIAKAFQVSIADVSAAVHAGKPLEKELFDRRDESFSERLEEMLAQLDMWKCEWIAFLLLDGEAWSPTEVYIQVTRDRLRNMIEAWAASIEEQRRQAWLEDGGGD